MKYLLNGEDFNIDAFHIIGDIQYPVGWFHDKVNRDAMGVTELDDGPAEPAPPLVPQEVTMRQARLALLGAGLLAQIDPAIETLSSPQKEVARIEWDYSSAVKRDQPLVAVLGAELGLTSAQLDQLFITAAGL
jgi:hypothetical protein